MIQNNLGAAYWTLAEIRDKAKNSARAIVAYEEALRVYTLERHPEDYAMIQNNLGAAYRSLAAVMAKKENLAKAINAYEKALKIYTAANYPLYHKRVTANLELTRQQMRR
jgi:tetratricopeptide (TPR) repeat protein